MSVNRCVCHDVSFSTLRTLAAEGHRTIERLSAMTGCGTGCGMCRPYIRLMLASGRCEFRVMNEAELKSLLGDVRAGARELRTVSREASSVSRGSLER